MSLPHPDGPFVSPDNQHQFNFFLQGEIRFGPGYFSIVLDDRVIPVRIFGSVYLWDPHGKYLALQEWLNTDERYGPRTALTVINLENRAMAQLSIAEQGFISPLSFENDLLIYKKAFGGKGTTILYEVDLGTINNWELA